MGRITEAFSDEHRNCDDLFSEAENGAGSGDLAAASNAFAAFVDETERHFRREEEILFPEFERRTGHGGGPTNVMRSEHIRMRHLFAEMTACLGRGDGEHFLGLSETLLIMMQQHNAKEEQVLYPMADNVIAEDAEPLLEKTKSI
jgi:DUF438 domain-containing protein